MERIGTKKFMAVTTMEMVLMMLVISVANAGNSLVPSHHSPSVPSSPLPLRLFPLPLPLPPLPRRLLSLHARNDVMAANLVDGISKVRKTPKVLETSNNYGTGTSLEISKFEKLVAKIPIFSKIHMPKLNLMGKMFTGMMICDMICPSDHVSGACSYACHPISTLEVKSLAPQN
jgi:hypothetical protein